MKCEVINEIKILSMRRKGLFMMFCLILMIAVKPLSAQAQTGLQIASVFLKYGHQRGSKMVVLSNEMLDAYDMDVYKSLTIANASYALPDIWRALEHDKRGAKKIKEVISQGRVQSGYYLLPQRREDVNRFILFKLSRRESATLIYIEGELDTEDLVTLLFKQD